MPIEELLPYYGKSLSPVRMAWSEFCSDVSKAISIKAKAKAKAECLQEQDKPRSV